MGAKDRMVSRILTRSVFRNVQARAASADIVPIHEARWVRTAAQFAMPGIDHSCLCRVSAIAATAVIRLPLPHKSPQLFEEILQLVSEVLPSRHRLVTT